MSKHLDIGARDNGKRFSLPNDIITQSVAILAKRRVGKSYTSDVIAEELLAMPQQTVIIDPTGVHWGLRSSADGKKAGFPIVVFGGKHADVPLEEGGGEMLARSIVEQRFSAIIDTSLLQKGQTLRFLDGFLKTLYHLNSEPLHLILDEVDYYCPQMTRNPQEAITTSHVDDLVRRGGVKGIGVTLITQRSSVVNKNVLTQCEVLITLRLVHPLDIKAVMDWIGVHGSPQQAKLMVDSLPALPVGTAWFWWPSEEIFERVKVRTRQTFDSGRTPKPGDKVKAPKVLAPVDLERLGDAMRATIEKAKADDPKLLRKRIAELEAEAKKRVPAPAAPAVPKIVKVPALTEPQVKRIEKVVQKFTDAVNRHRESAQAILLDASKHVTTLTQALAMPEPVIRTITIAGMKQGGNGTFKVSPPGPAGIVPVQHKAADRPLVTDLGAPLPAGERAILTAAAQHAEGITREQATVLTGYKRSTRDAYIARLTTRGYITVGSVITATNAGIAALGSDYKPLPTGDELLQHWLRELPEGERKVLQCAVDVYPNVAGRETITEITGYKRSTRDAYIARLSNRKLVEPMNAGIIASKTLFD